MEQNRLQKMQMKNACKNLVKVDEFISGIQGKKAGKPIDSDKLNEALTDLRDALNMLNS